MRALFVLEHKTSYASRRTSWPRACSRLWTRPRRNYALAKRALNLRFIWPTTCVDLHRLATTCVDLRWLWSSSNLDASRRKFSPFGHPTQVDTSWSQVHCICVKFTAFCDLRELASRFANPFGHPSQVRTQVLVLRRLASPFGQGLTRKHVFYTQHTSCVIHR